MNKMKRNFLDNIKYNFSKYKIAYLFIFPTFVAMLLMHFFPIIQAFYMAFLRLNNFTLNQYLGAPFIGTENFYDVLLNPDSPMRTGIYDAIRNTIIYSFVVTIGQTAVGMIVALMLSYDFKGRGLVRTLFMFSWIVPTYVTGILWGFMFQQSIGIINIILVDWLGILAEKPFWLVGFNSIWAIIIPTIWRFWPFSMLMLLAGIQNIPMSLYDAAKIDGAGKWKTFWKITLPMLSPVWMILVLFGMIYNTYSFNIVIMMFGQGAGFPGEWGDLMMTNIFRNSFMRWDFGAGAATSVLLLMVMIVAVNFWYSYYKRTEEIF
jgi:multiple sugar transport system permease protein